MDQETAERAYHNYQRLKILRALNKYRGVGRWVEFEELRDLMRKWGAPMAPQQLEYHLCLMADCALGWVELEIGEGERRGDEILAVRLRTAGVDSLDEKKVLGEGKSER